MNLKLKHLIKSIPLVGPLGRKINQTYRAWKTDVSWHLRRALRQQKNAWVVQIGSNDGSTNDPIRALLLAHPAWQALCIEPVPFLFQKLVKNYPSEARFHFENVAISASAGTSRFFYVSPEAIKHLPDLPAWYDQLGSFDRHHITKHLGGALEQFIVSQDVPTLSLPEVLARHRIPQIDLLHIDTEGYDWMILRQLDLTKYRPKAILFEHHHLSEADKILAREFLKDYSIKQFGEDYFCQRKMFAHGPAPLRPS
jgi:FkbM family methyltransferase